jgi:hypothetical protein
MIDAQRILALPGERCGWHLLRDRAPGGGRCFGSSSAWGPNGAGKTTTIKMILGLGAADQRRDPSGRLRRAPGAQQSPAPCRRDPGGLTQRLLAADGARQPGIFRCAARHAGQDAQERIDEVLALVELSDRADEEVRYLSRACSRRSPWRPPSCTTRTCCCWTSRPWAWTCRPRARSSG